MTQREQLPSSEVARPFLRLAQSVERRLFFRAWFTALHRTALPLLGVVLLALVAAWISGMGASMLGGGFATSVAFALLWVAACALHAYLHRPGVAAALARFDARSGGEEIFVSAYSFALDPRRGAGEALHIQRAQAALEEARTELHQVLPLRVTAPAGWVPAACLLLIVFGLGLIGLSAGTPPAAEASATVEAALVAASIDSEARSLEDLDAGLTDEEVEQLERLKKRLEDSAQRLSDPAQDKSARDVLEELEKRAAQAEALAAKLGADGEQLGSALLAELERHADTAELAGALRGQKLAQAAQEASRLARRLRTEGLSLEARKRIERAFQSGLAAATESDRKTLLGLHMSQARDELKSAQPKAAAAEFDALARRYQQMLERKNVMQTLGRLAENLRTSGQRALRGNEGPMRRLARTKPGQPLPSGLAQVGAQPLRLALAPPRTHAPGKTRDPLAGSFTDAKPPPHSGTPVPGTQIQPRAAAPECEKCREAKAAQPGSSGNAAGQTPVPGAPASTRPAPGGLPSGAT